MRSLCLLALAASLLSSQVAPTFASPTVWCDNSPLEASTLDPTAAGTYTMTTCTITGLVSISGASLPALPSEVVEVLVTGSVLTPITSA